MNKAKLIEDYLSQAKNPDFDLDLVREDMIKKGLDEQDIKAIIRYIDSQLQRKAEAELKNIERTKLIVGGIITALGTISALLFFMGRTF
ncbi:hypothetical protein [Marinigracilibium pacificum]|uniref:Uncharacterized protein n=1 Tax=Marinigracilibium pacificum TaxID=2729599 RepID=A0A848J486_9BACT|nr:hypothetical protein [Marinigracilibium pacificum]NMM50128.1 hypothetical protein [Marinigracilibium pacificum]